MKDKERDGLDGLIDGALARYSGAEPLEGLEERVLRRIEAAGVGRRRPWVYGLGFAVPALAALLVASVVLPRWWKPVAPITNATTLRPPSPSAALLEAPASRVAKAKARSVRLRALPKEERFPAPAPMTREERALVAWAGRAPAEVRQVFADLQRRNDEPLAIPPIQIQPLESDGEK